MIFTYKNDKTKDKNKISLKKTTISQTDTA